MPGLEETPTWQALIAHQQEVGDLGLRSLFTRDPKRFVKFSLRLGDILFDFSMNRITKETLSLSKPCSAVR